MSSPIKPMLLLNFVAYIHTMFMFITSYLCSAENIFLELLLFFSLDMVKIVTLTSMWTQLFAVFTWSKCYKFVSVIFCLNTNSVIRRVFSLSFRVNISKEYHYKLYNDTILS